MVLELKGNYNGTFIAFGLLKPTKPIMRIFVIYVVFNIQDLVDKYL